MQSNQQKIQVALIGTKLTSKPIELLDKETT